MKDIKYLKTTLVMIFPSDDIYFVGFNNESAIEIILSKFSLNRVPLPPQFPLQLSQILFQNGVFEKNNKKYIIEQLSIDDRKIIINILSPSDISDLFFKELQKLLIDLDLRDNKGSYEPLICTYETTCIVKLDINLNQLLSNINCNKIEKLISTKNNYGAKVSLIPYSVRFQISYNDIPDILAKNKISISDKSMVIELREKTNPDDQIYFTVSPTDTETHLELLKNIEKMFE